MNTHNRKAAHLNGLFCLDTCLPASGSQPVCFVRIDSGDRYQIFRFLRTAAIISRVLRGITDILYNTFRQTMVAVPFYLPQMGVSFDTGVVSWCLHAVRMSDRGEYILNEKSPPLETAGSFSLSTGLHSQRNGVIFCIKNLMDYCFDNKNWQCGI